MDVRMNLTGSLRGIKQFPRLFPAFVRTEIYHTIRDEIEPKLASTLQDVMKQMAVNRDLTLRFKKERLALIDTKTTFKDGRVKGFFETKGLPYGDLVYVYGISVMAPLVYGLKHPVRKGNGASGFTKLVELVAWLHGGPDLRNPSARPYTPKRNQRLMFEWVWRHYRDWTQAGRPQPQQKAASAAGAGKKAATAKDPRLAAMTESKDVKGPNKYRSDQLFELLRQNGGFLDGIPFNSAKTVYRKPRPFFLVTFEKMKAMMMKKLREGVLMAAHMALQSQGRPTSRNSAQVADRGHVANTIMASFGGQLSTSGLPI